MRKKPAPRPTDAELAILRVLWKLGASTVREVHEVLNKTRPTGYTTALKLMQIMHEKGLISRDESARAHVYRTSLPEGKTQQTLVRDLLDRAFGGSAQQLVMRALQAKKTSPEELAEIRQLIEELEAKNREDSK